MEWTNANSAEMQQKEIDRQFGLTALEFIFEQNAMEDLRHVRRRVTIPANARFKFP